MGVAVEQVSSRSDMLRFIKLPLTLYAGDPFYVPHLTYERKAFFGPKNPLFEFTEVRYLLARDAAGRVVGRCTAHVNENQIRAVGRRVGCFGFLEAADDPEAFGALLGAAEEWLRERGCECVQGPYSFSTNEECGLLVRGFDRLPSFMMPYNPPRYAEAVERLGYAKAKDLVAYEMVSGGRIPEHLERFAQRAAKRGGVEVRSIDMKRFDEDVQIALETYNRAWSENWGFVPMTDAQFRHMAADLRPVVDPCVALIAEVDGAAVGFSIALPDYNLVLRKLKGRLFPFGIVRLLRARRRLHRLRVLTMGVVKDFRRKGVEALLIYETFARGHRNGYYEGEFGWVLEDNEAMCRILDRMGATATKTYRIYEKAL